MATTEENVAKLKAEGMTRSDIEAGIEGLGLNSPVFAQILKEFPEDKPKPKAGKIDRVKDADTLVVDGNVNRVASINTAESVHLDRSKNTVEGAIASDFAKKVQPVGADVAITKQGKGLFKRDISLVDRVIDGVPIDMGFVMMDQGFSQYETTYGKNADPLRHKDYKEYYSKYAPYEYGDVKTLLTDDEKETVELGKAALATAIEHGNQEEIDAALVNLYKDPGIVARYRKEANDFEAPAEEFDGTVKNAFQVMSQKDPSLKAKYNKAIKAGGLQNMGKPHRYTSFWENFEASYEQYSSIVNSLDANELSRFRRSRVELEVPNKELVENLPEQYHTLIQQEYATTGGLAALTLRDQIIEQHANNEIIDNLPMYAQFGFGIGAAVTDPGTWITGAGVGQLAQKSHVAVRAWQTSAPFKAAAHLSTWAGLGAVEGSLYALPRLAADHTYSVNDYALDIVMDATFGMALGTAAVGVKKAWNANYSKEAKEARQKEIQEITEKGAEMKIENPVKVEDVPYVADVKQAKSPYETNETVSNWVGPPEQSSLRLQDAKSKTSSKPEVSPETQKQKQKVNLRSSVRQAYTSLEAITSVPQKGYRLALDTIGSTFPPNSVMSKVLNTQKGINNRNLDPAARLEADKLNATVLKLAAQFPDGKVPKAVEQQIRAVMWEQNLAKHENALGDILQGHTADVENIMHGYMESLRRQEDLWEGYDPINLSTDEFYAQHSDLVSKHPLAHDDAISLMQEVLPKELSFIRDMLELNSMAQKKNSPEFTELVEELNGLVAVRMEQKTFGETRRYTDSNTSFAEKVAMSPDEIMKQVKSEGLKPKTPEFKARMKELRQQGQDVAQDVRDFGRADDYAVGGSKEDIPTDKSKRYDADSDGSDIEATPIARDTFNEDSIFATKKTVAGEESSNSGDFVEGQDLFDRTSRTDQLEQDLLPRSYTSYTKQKAHEELNANSLSNLNRRLNEGVGKSLGINKLNNVDLYFKKERLSNIKRDMLKDKKFVVGRMVGSRSMDELVDVMRVSNQIAIETRKTAVNTKHVEGGSSKESGSLEKSAKQKREADDALEDTSKDDVYDELSEEAQARQDALSKPLTEEEVDVYVNEPETLTVDELEATEIRLDEAVDQVAADSAGRVGAAVANFLQSGQQKQFELARKHVGVLDFAGKLAGKITQDLTTTLQNSGIPSLEYFGAMVPESARGYAGTIKRGFTGAIIRDAKYKESIMQIMPNYVRAMDDFAAEEGAGAIGKLMAAQKDGASNPTVNKFNREVFRVQESRRQGRPLGKVSPTVTKFVDDFDNYMDRNHAMLVDAQVGGFTAKRKVQHYIPHVWKVGNLKGMESKHGTDFVRDLLAKGYMNASGRDVPISREKAIEMANEQIDWIKKQEETPEDQFVPTADSRAKQRKEIDTTAEIDGVSVLDLLDTEVASLTTKYSNRVGGWVGLADSTNGTLRSDTDIDALRSQMKEEGATPDQVQWYDDTVEMMMGRPTRDGLDERVRNFKDAAALTRMGGLGMAQAIETGQVIARTMMNTFTDPQVVKKVFRMANESIEDKPLMEEIQSISNLTNDIEWLDRQSVHLDQHELDKSNKVRALSLQIADKATFGSLKAPASRLLGKTSGYNAIRRYQSRIVQASFMNDIARHFNDGTGKMGNLRMADVGLTDVDGTNPAMKEAFKKHAEFGGGVLKKLNIDKWPKQQREELQFAMIRDEAQQIQRTMIGEAPPWMNRPMLAVVAQFREMAIVAQNKQLARSMAFADREAVTAVMLNAAMAGVVRYAKFAGLAAGAAAITQKEWEEPTAEGMRVDKYITQFGIASDAYDLAMTGAQVGKDGQFDRHDIDRVMGEMPMYGLMKDYANVGLGMDQGRVDAVQGIVPLGNTAYGDHIFTMINEIIKEK